MKRISAGPAKANSVKCKSHTRLYLVHLGSKKLVLLAALRPIVVLYHVFHGVHIEGKSTKHVVVSRERSRIDSNGSR